jgi:hypothetical protein
VLGNYPKSGMDHVTATKVFKGEMMVVIFGLYNSK